MAATKQSFSPTAGITVEGVAYEKGNPIDFYSIDSLLADVEAKVDRSNKAYYKKEAITFTITLKRSAEAITNGIDIAGIKVTDTLPSIVDFLYDATHTDSVVVKAKGSVITPTVDYNTGTKLLTISGLNLTTDFGADDTITIDIIGKIKE